MEKITAFLEDFDFAKLLPKLGDFLSDLRTWTTLFLLIGPIVMLLLGLWYFFLPTREANHHIGFRTFMGMGSVAAWRFSQWLAGLCYMGGGGLLTVITVIFAFVIKNKAPMEMATTALKLLIAQVIVAVLIWLALQIIIPIFYDVHGNRRPPKKKK